MRKEADQGRCTKIIQRRTDDDRMNDGRGRNRIVGGKSKKGRQHGNWDTCVEMERTDLG